MRLVFLKGNAPARRRDRGTLKRASGKHQALINILRDLGKVSSSSSGLFGLASERSGHIRLFSHESEMALTVSSFRRRSDTETESPSATFGDWNSALFRRGRAELNPIRSGSELLTLIRDGFG